MMKRIFLAILILTATGIYAFGQTTISGNVSSAINGKPLQQVVVLIKGTTNGVMTDSTGHYVLNLSFGKVTLTTSSIGYTRIDTTVSVTEPLVIDFQLKADCRFNRQRAKLDISTGKLKLLLVGSIAPTANSAKDKRFMKRFKLDYYDFGDNVIAEECIEEYNKSIFEYLDKTYGHKWRETVRLDVIGLN
jgi:CarboxypepD_reg-like domain